MKSSNAKSFGLDPREFDSEEFQKDPFPIYKYLRENEPLYHDRFHNKWILSRYQDISNALTDVDQYDRAIYRPDGPYKFGSGHIFGPNMLEYGDGPRHRWLRNIVASSFVGQNLKPLDTLVAKVADELIDGFRSDRSVDIVARYANQLPVRVISNMLGLPRDDEEIFVSWYQSLIRGLGFGGEHLSQALIARNEMWEYIDPLIDERSNNKGSDLLSKIVNAELDGRRMSRDEVKGFVALLLAAGGDTTDKAISNMWYHMLYTRPDQYREVKHKPELWNNVFSEMLRFDPVVHVLFRQTVCEVALHDQVIPERASMVLFLGSGHRDERVFKDPDTFDIFRSDLHMGMESRSGRYKDAKSGHLGFCLGTHFCLGWIMARQEAILACMKLQDFFGNPVGEIKEHPGIVAPSLGSGGFRGPNELWITRG